MILFSKEILVLIININIYLVTNLEDDPENYEDESLKKRVWIIYLIIYKSRVEYLKDKNEKRKESKWITSGIFVKILDKYLINYILKIYG